MLTLSCHRSWEIVHIFSPPVGILLLKEKRHAGLGAQQSAKFGELTELGLVWSKRWVCLPEEKMVQ